MLDAARARETLAKREALPDVTFTAGYANRAGGFRDMWSLSMGIPLPIYFGYKQKPGIAEASAGVSASRFELEGARTMLLSSVRENLAAVRSAERLMALYREGLIPKTRQDLDFTLAGYLGGKGDVAPLLTRLKALYDYEFAYWTQFTEREKAIARIDAVTGTGNGTQGDTGK
jgi:outer membrane protein TolC